MSHLKCLGDDDRGPMERSKVNSILNINDPMPRNGCQREDRNQRTRMGTSYIKADAELQILNCRKILSVRGFETSSTPLTQKDTMG